MFWTNSAKKISPVSRHPIDIRVERAFSCLQKRGKGDRAAAQHGLTLLEMIVVLTIIAIVAALIVPNVIGRPDQARVTMAGADLRTVSSALEMYRLDNGRYPSTEQGLTALVERPATSPVPDNWHAEGYLDQVPLDPWGNAYLYRTPGETGRFDLVSYGADGEPGGEGYDADITSRDRVQ